MLGFSVSFPEISSFSVATRLPAVGRMGDVGTRPGGGSRDEQAADRRLRESGQARRNGRWNLPFLQGTQLDAVPYHTIPYHTIARVVVKAEGL